MELEESREEGRVRTSTVWKEEKTKSCDRKQAVDRQGLPEEEAGQVSKSKGSREELIQKTAKMAEGQT